MPRSFLAFLIFAFAGIASAKKAAFVPRASVFTADVLSIRGGAGPLDPTDTAKVGTLLAGAQASLTLLSPSRILKEYGAPSSPTLEFMAQWHGEVIMAFSLYAYYLIFRGSSIEEAFTATLFPWIAMSVKVFWNEDAKKVGFAQGGQWINLILSIFSMYASLSGAEYLDSVMKLVCFYTLASGLFMALAPNAAGKAWKINEITNETEASAVALGHFLLGNAVFAGSLLFFDMDKVQAFGLAWIPALLLQIRGNFITNELEKLGMPKMPSLIWMAVDAIMVVTCGFPKK